MGDYFVYIIKSENGRRYIGSTINLTKRLDQHNSKESFWTSRYKNWKVIYFEKFETRTDALCREKYLKKIKKGERINLRKYWKIFRIQYRELEFINFYSIISTTPG